MHVLCSLLRALRLRTGKRIYYSGIIPVSLRSLLFSKLFCPGLHGTWDSPHRTLTRHHLCPSPPFNIHMGVDLMGLDLIRVDLVGHIYFHTQTLHIHTNKSTHKHMYTHTHSNIVPHNCDLQQLMTWPWNLGV